ncbi:hypothetical protein ACWY4P_52920 [Streptomyces sp. LZ34]
MDTLSDNASLKSQYATQVAADLERNAKEQERISTEIGSLQAQLAVLESNRVLLLSIQQTLGNEATSDVTGNAADTSTAAESPARQQSAVLPRPTARKHKTADATAKKKETASDKNRPKRPREAGAPTLRELLIGHLTEHGGPRSAAEITTALAQALPDREIKATVVRSTLESLVAKSQVHRTKQQKSVFYSTTAPDATTGTAEPGPAPTA